jgi:hypothetical protein
MLVGDDAWDARLVAACREPRGDRRAVWALAPDRRAGAVLAGVLASLATEARIEAALAAAARGGGKPRPGACSRQMVADR